ncbi:MAG: pyridoxal phosphate-dependent aminotransferase [Gemmatimonadaceae bacterium]
MRYSTLTQRIAGEGSDAWIVHDLAIQRQAAGQDIILLSIGDPDFDTPAVIRRAAIDAIEHGRTHYSPIRGEVAVRSAIAEQAKQLIGVDVGPDHVTMFPGAQAALFAAAQCLFERDDEVIVAEPAYVTYEAVLGAPGARMVQIPLRPENRFHLDPREVERAITSRTRGILLNFPHNPTGACLSPDTAREVAALCRQHDLWCLSDEVYASLNFALPHQSPLALPGMLERGVLISSLSKSHAMTGWRCGWTVTTVELAHHLDHMARAMFFGVAQFVQDAAAAALRTSGEDLERIRTSYVHRARTVVDALADAPGIVARMPDAGMYIFADVRGTGLDGKQFARGLLDAEGVSVTPGEGFGPSGAGHVRITLGVDHDRLREACRRMTRFAASCTVLATPRP